MSPRHKPTEEEARQVVEVLLGALEAGEDIFDALDEVRPVHPKDNFWSYAGLAAVAWVRAVADQRGIALADLCARLGARASTAKHASW